MFRCCLVAVSCDLVAVQMIAIAAWVVFVAASLLETAVSLAYFSLVGSCPVRAVAGKLRNTPWHSADLSGSRAYRRTCCCPSSQCAPLTCAQATLIGDYLHGASQRTHHIRHPVAVIGISLWMA